MRGRSGSSGRSAEHEGVEGQMEEGAGLRRVALQLWDQEEHIAVLFRRC